MTEAAEWRGPNEGQWTQYVCEVFPCVETWVRHQAVGESRLGKGQRREITSVCRKAWGRGAFGVAGERR